MFDRKYSYVGAYKALVNRLAEDGVYVIDKTTGWAMPKISANGWLFVSSTLGRKRRLYALAHEVGHLYCWPRYGKIKRSTTKLRSEWRANEFALRVCKLLVGQDIKKPYKYFKKRVKIRRKYLRNVYGGLELREMVV